MIPSPYNLITILGPTASGKTSVAANLAYRMNGEIISGDSRQVYKRMDLGTGKDYQDYEVKGQQIPFHLIDVYDPGYKYNVFEFQQDFTRVYSDIISRDKTPILCGGSGLYIESVIRGYRMMQVPVNTGLRASLEQKSLEELTVLLSGYKRLHNKTDIDTCKRAIRAIEIEEYSMTHPDILSTSPEIRSITFGIRFDRARQMDKIYQRLLQRVNEGMIEEVKSLLESGLKPEDLVYYGLEYKYLTLYLTGQLSMEEMIEKLNIAIRQFAKRQMTWFRKMERDGIVVHWIDAEKPMEEKIKEIMSIINT